ncbi:hypothetical protein M0G74_14420 [Microbulbifer sp. CAU 1566]|uniref:hypothetical protein n=1 Tax=Microbulbifer sp. CAU 1566 TaxID=2933269 RepID=UPI0020046FA4|nr:hypothetical protein [Microbulbifer sp. CAU 1566]MCK7598472.1 hypothetical protein [Microbulbifer sp. CAU 1566]
MLLSVGEWICKVFSRFLKFARLILLKIPILNSIFHFNLDCHQRSVKKFFVLWLSATSPVLLALFFTLAEGGAWSTAVLKTVLSSSELLVYTAAFIPPFLYLIYERYTEKSPRLDGGDSRFMSFRKFFEGYWLNCLVAVVVLVLSVVAFTIDKVASQAFKESLIFVFFESLAPYLYVFSLYCWYLTILDSFGNEFNFLDHVRADENEKSMEFRKRLAKG